MIAMMKYMMIGAIEVLSAPKLAKIMIRIIVINNPDRAVPTVYFDTTFCER